MQRQVYNNDNGWILFWYYHFLILRQFFYAQLLDLSHHFQTCLNFLLICSFGLYPAKLVQKPQQSVLLHLVSRKTISQNDIMGSTLNCLNATENISFACFVCQKDCTLSAVLRKSTLKVIKITKSFKENIMQITLNKHFQAYICKI